MPPEVNPPTTPELAPSAINVSTPARGTDGNRRLPVPTQLILGTDKRNPVFTVFTDDLGRLLYVYYGFEVIEIVANNREVPAFKLMLARLYNARIKLCTLCDVFELDAKTIRRWGKAVLGDDAVELVRVLEGRGAGRKRTQAVENFARLRWPDLVAERSYGAVGRLLREIQIVFDVEISRSALKDLIRDLKAANSSSRSR